jgi:hypothetical protein
MVISLATIAFSQSTQQDQNNGVSFLDVQGASPGHEASVTVQATPNTDCSIVYITPSGRASRARGLDDKTSDSGGKVSWSWLIGGNTKRGTGTVTVTCDGKSATAQIDIGD